MKRGMSVKTWRTIRTNIEQLPFNELAAKAATCGRRLGETYSRRCDSPNDRLDKEQILDQRLLQNITQGLSVICDVLKALQASQANLAMKVEYRMIDLKKVKRDNTNNKTSESL